MLLYSRPEMLSRAHHGHLGIRPSERPFDFARGTRLIPLSVSEMPSAQKVYPVVFSEEEHPVPIAMVGAFDDRNLFVDDTGNWESDCYVPSYLRCYPFALARNQDGRYAVVIDRDASVVTDDPQVPFFDGEELSADIQNMVDLCSRVEEDRDRTRVFVAKLQELELLVRQGSTHTPVGATEAIPIASYLAVDVDKLKALPADALAEIHGRGYLWPIYAHLLSLENWQRLINRKERVAAN